MLSSSSSLNSSSLSRVGALTSSSSLAHGCRQMMMMTRRNTCTPTRKQKTRFAIKAQWPDAVYISNVIEQFPEKGIASVEEGRCLWDDGYDVLDVRDLDEIDANEKCPNPLGVDIAAQPNKGNRLKVIPLVNAKRKYDFELNEKVYVQTGLNPNFSSEVQKAYPDKNKKLMVVCSDGRTRAIKALETLDELGYLNIVGIKGGANLWNREWDAKMRRRNLPGQFKQNFSHAGDSPQLHGTGGQFQKADSQSYSDPRDPVEWICE
jgi:rhodanese-related sulfurtransferase